MKQKREVIIIDYIHVIEDDTILSKNFMKYMTILRKERPPYSILVTDMYANPSTYNEQTP